MPSFTTNHKFSKPYESENYDVNIQNSNWDIVDKLPYIVSAGTTTAYRSNVNASTAQYKKITWYYKKFSDHTLEAYAVAADISGWACSDKQKQDGTWRSGYIRFYYPSLGQKTIFNRSAFVSQADNDAHSVWVADVSAPGDGSNNASYESIRIISTTQEAVKDAPDKNVYLSFRATW